MHDRIWTVLIVGDDTTSPRSLRLSARAVRTASWALAIAMLATLVGSVATGVALGRQHPVGHQLSTTDIPSDPAVAARIMGDSIRSLSRQTSALRVVAGLTDSTPAVAENEPVDTLIVRADRLSADLQQVAVKLHGDVERVARTPSIMPTAGWLTSQFSLSRFHPILHKYLPHLGIDIAAPFGTTIVAPAAGTVIRAGSASGYGFVMEIDHGNGIVTKYGHLSRFLVRERQEVVRGQPIAQVGNSGLATGPHLHYEVHVNGTIVDPLTYVLPSSIPDAIHPTAHTAAAPED